MRHQHKEEMLHPSDEQGMQISKEVAEFVQRRICELNPDSRLTPCPGSVVATIGAAVVAVTDLYQLSHETAAAVVMHTAEQLRDTAVEIQAEAARAKLPGGLRELLDSMFGAGGYAIHEVSVPAGADEPNPDEALADEIEPGATARGPKAVQ